MVRSQALLVAGWSVRCALRRPLRTLSKVLVPPAALLVLVVLRQAMQSTTGCDTAPPAGSSNRSYCNYSRFSPLEGKRWVAARNETVLHFTPPEYSKVAAEVAGVLGLIAKSHLTEKDIEDTMRGDPDVYSETLAALVFHPVQLNQHSYSIRMKSWVSRWNTERLYPVLTSPAPRANGSYTGPPLYLESGFLALQLLVDSALTGVDLTRAVSLKKFPHPPYTRDLYLSMIRIVLPLLLLISYGLLAADLVREVTEQRDSGMKEYLTLNGMSRTSYWSSWFMVALLQFLPTTLLNLLVLYLGDAIQYTDMVVMQLFLFTFTLSSIALSFLISAVSRSPMSSMMCSVVLWLILYAPFFFIESDFDTISEGWQSMACLLPPLALGIGCRLIGEAEMSGIGLSFSNIGEADLGIAFSTVLAIMLADAVLFTAIAIYFDRVLPRKFGYPDSCYFCLASWGPPCMTDNKRRVSEDTPLLKPNKYASRDFYENIPKTLRIGINLNSVEKEYSDGKQVSIALNNTDFAIVEGEITVILGPNGSGKSTLVGLMAGFVRPSSGEVTVSGMKLSKDLRVAQKRITYTPQANLLFPELTVDENLKYHAALRGLHPREVEHHTEETMHLLGLTPLSDFKAGTLSGGQKRKLALAIALVADPSVILLDEPMAGMDVENRALVCSVLARIKRTCTIVLCTHCVDDAVQIADRIAILLDNKLHCYGTPPFISSGFGIGYTLSLLKDEEGCQDNNISKSVLHSVKKSKVVISNSRELTFSLPKSSEVQMASVLERLEDESDILGIAKIVVTENTLEEAYNQLVTGGLLWGTSGGLLKKQGSFDRSKSRSQIKTPASSSSAGASGKSRRRQSLAPSGVERNSSRSPRSRSPSVSISRDEELRLLDIQTDKTRRVPEMIPAPLWAQFIKNATLFRRHWLLSLSMVTLPALFCVLMFLVLNIGKQSDVTTPILLWATTYAGSTIPYTTIGNKSVKLESIFIIILEGSGAKLLNIDETAIDMDTFLLDTEEYMGFVEFRKKYAIAEELEEGTVSGRFGDSTIHAAPIALSVANNAYSAAMGSNRSTRTLNKPLPLLEGEGRRGNSIALMTLYLLGVSFLVSLAVVIPVAETASGARHLLQFNGLRPLHFWLGVYGVVMVLALVSSFVCAAATLTTEEPAFFLHSRWLYVLLITLLYFSAGLPLSLLLAGRCTTPTTAYAVCELVNKGLGFVTVVLYGVFCLEEVDMREVADILSWVFMFLPSFSAAHAMNSLYRDYNLEQQCKTGRCLEEPAPSPISLQQPGIGGNLAALLLSSIGYLFLLLGYEEVRRRILAGRRHVVRVPMSALHEEEGVANERDRVYQDNSTDLIVIKDLQKVYRNAGTGVVGLNDLTIGVCQGETFGLLGGNGAGKSTTFRILTGAELEHGGSVKYQGVDLRVRPRQPNVGYCPQFPALIPALTVQQHMVLFARVKNQSEQFLSRDVVKIMKLVGMIDLADTLVESLSSGNRKRLGVAIALIGVPSILLLDEPTSGLDEEGRRLVVSLLTKLRERGTATLITSHNMAESEVLCNRIGILANGSLQCLGPVDQLKKKFGNYTVIKVTLAPSPQDIIDSRMASLGSFISVNFLGAEIKEIKDRVVTYAIPCSAEVKWSVLFKKLHLNSDQLGVQDYSVSHASLAQVYLAITRDQLHLGLSVKDRKKRQELSAATAV